MFEIIKLISVFLTFSANWHQELASAGTGKTQISWRSALSVPADTKSNLPQKFLKISVSAGTEQNCTLLNFLPPEKRNPQKALKLDIFQYQLTPYVNFRHWKTLTHMFRIFTRKKFREIIIADTGSKFKTKLIQRLDVSWQLKMKFYSASWLYTQHLDIRVNFQRICDF